MLIDKDKALDDMLATLNVWATETNPPGRTQYARTPASMNVAYWWTPYIRCDDVIVRYVSVARVRFPDGRLSREQFVEGHVVFTIDSRWILDHHLIFSAVVASEEKEALRKAMRLADEHPDRFDEEIDDGGAVLADLRRQDALKAAISAELGAEASEDDDA